MTTKYTKEHEWITIEGDTATIGITKFAAEQLGDVVFVEVPEAGLEVTAGGEMAVVESVKAASDVFAPVSGTITEGNAALAEAPEIVNEDPEGAGWFAKMTISHAGELETLMDREAYDAFVAGQ